MPDTVSFTGPITPPGWNLHSIGLRNHFSSKFRKLIRRHFPGEETEFHIHFWGVPAQPGSMDLRFFCEVRMSAPLQRLHFTVRKEGSTLMESGRRALRSLQNNFRRELRCRETLTR